MGDGQHRGSELVIKVIVGDCPADQETLDFARAFVNLEHPSVAAESLRQPIPGIMAETGASAEGFRADGCYHLS
jgi:hypothetical protein